MDGIIAIPSIALPRVASKTRIATRRSPGIHAGNTAMSADRTHGHRRLAQHPADDVHITLI
jgi:hypothetical protein